MKYKMLSDKAVMPFKASEGAGKYDVVCFDPVVDGGLLRFRTGLAFEVPKGYEIELTPRSSTSKKHGLMLANSVGTIDSDYRGEVYAHFFAVKPWGIRELDKPLRLVQMKLVKEGESIVFDKVDELSYTKRGTGGFGSTGK